MSVASPISYFLQILDCGIGFRNGYPVGSLLAPAGLSNLARHLLVSFRQPGLVWHLWGALLRNGSCPPDHSQSGDSQTASRKLRGLARILQPPISGGCFSF